SPPACGRHSRPDRSETGTRRRRAPAPCAPCGRAAPDRRWCHAATAGTRPPPPPPRRARVAAADHARACAGPDRAAGTAASRPRRGPPCARSEEHTSELQSRFDLVCRLLLEKKKHNTADILQHFHSSDHAFAKSSQILSPRNIIKLLIVISQYIMLT